MSAFELRELTPRGRAAVTVLEVRGTGALDAVQRLTPGVRLTNGALRVAELRHAGRALDQALVVVHGEQLVELHLHGSPSVVAEVSAGLAAQDSAPRALTLEELALELLASAPCEAAARILLDQSQGALRREIERLLALSGERQREVLEQMLAVARVAQHALTPLRVLLCGPVNAGKSTLFNALHGADRVLVSDTAGTTRDVVVERVQLGAWPVDLWDTPGYRTAPTAPSRELELERAGLLQAQDLFAGADVLLWITPADCDSAAPPTPADRRWIEIVSCADRLSDSARRERRDAISALCDPAGTASAVERRLRERLDLPRDPWSAGRAVPFAPYQRALIESALAASPGARDPYLSGLLAPRVAGPQSACVAGDAPVR